MKNCDREIQKRHSENTNNNITEYKITYFRKLAAGILCLFVSFLIFLVSDRVPGAAEWYAKTVYPVIVSVVGRAFGIFTVSCVEILLYCCLALLVVSVILLIWKLIKARMIPGRILFLEWLSRVFLVGTVLFLLYTLNCGINYHRLSFSELEGIRPESYSLEDLEMTCRYLTEEVNVLSEKVKRDAMGGMVLSGQEREKAVNAMMKLGEKYPELSGYYPEPKPVMFSEILSYQNLSGVYSPFTVEANYNQDMTDYNVPFTMCHELSHLRGFMEEEEANFIAYLACEASEEAEFQYSGNLLAWIYCMNTLKKYDENTWYEIHQQLEEKVLQDLGENSEFWKVYEGPIAERAEQLNDTYLRANGQAEGINSYNRMTDLMVSYFKEKDKEK